MSGHVFGCHQGNSYNNVDDAAVAEKILFLFATAVAAIA